MTSDGSQHEAGLTAGAPNRKPRRPAPLPDIPVFPMPIKALNLFGESDARELLAHARLDPIDPEPKKHAERLNWAFFDAIHFAGHADTAPNPDSLRGSLTQLGDDSVWLLERMGLNADGKPPERIPVLTTPMQPWFQWLQSGLHRTIEDAAEAAGSEAASAVDCLVAFAEDILGHEMCARLRLGTNEGEASVVYQLAVIEAAMERVPPVLVLLGKLSREAAKRVPGDGEKPNFEREFTNGLFTALAGVWFQTFGSRPTVVLTSKEESGSPALAWHQAVIERAHDMSGRLDDNAQKAIEALTRLSESTLAGRISKGAKRSMTIAKAESSNSAD